MLPEEGRYLDMLFLGRLRRLPPVLIERATRPLVSSGNPCNPWGSGLDGTSGRGIVSSRIGRLLDPRTFTGSEVDSHIRGQSLEQSPRIASLGLLLFLCVE